MSLAAYEPQRRTIPLRGGSVDVRGIGLDDVAVLMNLYLRDIDALFNLYDENVDEGSKMAAMAQFAIVLCREAPALVGHLIALAADEPDQIDKARRLSLPAQVEILKAIFELTFEEAGGSRKFFESLGMLLRTLAPAAQKTGSPT
jgi:hypothetical protein